LQASVWIGDFNWFSNVESKWLEFNGSSSQESNAANVSILLTEKLLFPYIIELQNIYVFYKSESTVCWQYVLVVLSSFNYVEVSMMFMRNDVWLKSVIWTDLKDLIVSCRWDLNYANVDWWIEVLNCLWIYIGSMS
jgi:hypothetical protein